MPNADRPPVRTVYHNQSLDIEGLRASAREAVAGMSQSEVAEALGVSQATVSRALSDPKPGVGTPHRYASVLRRIVATFTDFEVSEEPAISYLITRKKSAEG